MLPVKLAEKNTNRLLNLREMSEFRGYEYQSFLDGNGLKFVRNTPAEICEVVEEMNDRIDGKWSQDSYDDELQKQYSSLLYKYRPDAHFTGKIGAKFLRNNQYLLH